MAGSVVWVRNSSPGCCFLIRREKTVPSFVIEGAAESGHGGSEEGVEVGCER